ncbi:MAG: aminoacetone oxidase family FAD-binding enzyme [Lachnospiraceae bacterium]|nr:aminoacetone oxidase family FAD-binding enzyme [Lachnospiraceae bacterium]
MKNIVIIGGGMSGMVAAIRAAMPGIRVTLLERQNRIGKKLLLTGSGRCNLTNREMHEDFYLTDEVERLKKILDAYSLCEEDLWKDLGLLTKEKNSCVYPLSGQAATVLNCLRLKLEEKGVVIRTDYEAGYIKKQNDRFVIETVEHKEKISADAVILACGGMSGVYDEQYKNGYALCKQLGHHILPCDPALVQTICVGDYFKGISGIRTDVRISLLLDDIVTATEDGELQITDQGLSGIAVFQLTRYLGEAFRAGRQACFLLNFIPYMKRDEWNRMMVSRRERMKHRSAEDFFTGILHKNLITMLLKSQNIAPGKNIDTVSEQDFQTLLDRFQCFRVKVKQLNDYRHAQISTGGVPLAEVDDTLTSTLVEHLYLTGEMLNVAGACGGYNLHFAAATGYLAGRSAAVSLQ